MTNKGKEIYAEESLVTNQTIFRNANDFSLYVEKLSISSGETCTSIILSYCEQKDIEPEDIAKLVSRPLKEKLQLEMQSIGLIKKESQLEFE
jgi:hypothetical protein